MEFTITAICIQGCFYLWASVEKKYCVLSTEEKYPVKLEFYPL